MANIENLVPLTTEKAREIGRKGGIASGKSRAERKTFRDTLLLLLSKGEIQDNITLAQIEKALKGDTKAFEVIRDTIGEKPIDKQDINQDTKIHIDMGTEADKLAD